MTELTGLNWTDEHMLQAGLKKIKYLRQRQESFAKADMKCVVDAVGVASGVAG